jgi:toxin YoeB
VIFDQQFREDLRWWAKKDRKILNRILDLVEAVITNPATGIGKPEKLKYLPGSRWSRRITQEHRLVYQIADNKLIFLQCRYHY